MCQHFQHFWPSLLLPPLLAAGFCVPTHPERKLGVDLETFFPWPSEGEIDAQNRRRRKDGKAHPYAKDPRRNVIRLLTVNTGTEVKVFDLFTETVPHDVRDFIRNSTLIIHNADFDVTVLRRHGFEVSSSIFDTLLASQLLSLGEVEPKRRKPKHLRNWKTRMMRRRWRSWNRPSFWSPTKSLLSSSVSWAS